MFSDPLTLLSQGLCITMDYYDITLGLPNNFPLSDRLIAVFIFINTDLSIYIYIYIYIYMYIYVTGQN